jgi:hypothetical protein
MMFTSVTAELFDTNKLAANAALKTINHAESERAAAKQHYEVRSENA